jgi:hypothetical protein
MRMKPSSKELLTEAVIGGLIGYASTALVMMLAGVIAGRSPFYSAALLGSALFYGIRDPAMVVVWPGPVLAYNGFHLVVFLVLGLIAAWLADMSERGPVFWYIGLSLFIFVILHIYGILLMLPESFRTFIPPTASLLATTVAAILMVVYLLWARPLLRTKIREDTE